MAMLRQQAYQLVHSCNALLHFTSKVKNSWSHIFNANQSLKRKVKVTSDVAASLVEMVVLLHGEISLLPIPLCTR